MGSSVKLLPKKLRESVNNQSFAKNSSNPRQY